MSLYQHKPHPHTPRNVNMLHKAELQSANFNNRLAVTITRVFGSIWAFYALILWMVVWMALASAGVWLFARDAYPFSFLLFLSNLVQLWALPVLAVGQSVLSRKAELQADEQFHTTEKIYSDMETIIKQNNEILAHLSDRSQVSGRSDREVPRD